VVCRTQHECPVVGGSFYFSNMLRQLSNNSLQIFLNFPLIKGCNMALYIFRLYTNSNTTVNFGLNEINFGLGYKKTRIKRAFHRFSAFG